MRVDRAEIKTYGNVILTGENDAGKTAALRLWVYFITGNRKMLGLDEGSQDFCSFYFPKPNSWIIYEMFSEHDRYMIILSCRNNVIFSRYVDEPYRREFFFDDTDRAYERWEDIADKIGKKASDFAEVKGDGVITKEVASMALGKMEIDPLGLDNIDRLILTTMIKNYNGGPVGLETLAAVIGEEAVTIEDVYEPYLMQLGFLSRTPRGRVVTPAAYNHIGIPMPGQQKFGV